MIVLSRHGVEVAGLAQGNTPPDQMSAPPACLSPGVLSREYWTDFPRKRFPAAHNFSRAPTGPCAQGSFSKDSVAIRHAALCATVGVSLLWHPTES